MVCYHQKTHGLLLVHQINMKAHYISSQKSAYYIMFILLMDHIPCPSKTKPVNYINNQTVQQLAQRELLEKHLAHEQSITHFMKNQLPTTHLMKNQLPKVLDY